MKAPSERGVAIAVTVIVVAIIVIGAGVAFYYAISRQAPGSPEVATRRGTETATVADSQIIPGNVIARPSYSGPLLAGISAPLFDFTKADFDIAVKSDKLVVVYFYANWCPTCAVEFPVMQSVFNELTTDQVIGFRVNYNDSDTDADEVALAREHGIAYQHTKVFLKNGKQILKSPETWDKERYLAEITGALLK